MRQSFLMTLSLYLLVTTVAVSNNNNERHFTNNEESNILFQNLMFITNPPKRIVKKELFNDIILNKDNFSASVKPKVKFKHKTFDMLLSKHVNDKGEVSYTGFIEDKATLKTYLNSLSELRPNDSWTKSDLLAYWMNVYNAFTIKLIIDYYPVKSIKDIKTPWDKPFIKLADKLYSLNDIEHNILRKMNDPRIHFGINCASYSCPPLSNKAFTSENVNAELDRLAKQFINDPTRNKISSTQVQLSKIFQWFAKDFKTDGSLIDFLNRYSNVTIRKEAKKSFLKYNWELND